MTATDGDVNAALRRLQGEVDRLTKERDEAQRLAGTMSGLRDAGERDYDALKLALAASQAEAAKLREALVECNKRLELACGCDGEPTARIENLMYHAERAGSKPWRDTRAVLAARAALSRPPGSREALRAMLTSDAVIEELAAVEHDQWAAWAASLLETEPSLSQDRRERWAGFLVPYHMLPNETREHDRKWARKAVAAIVARLLPEGGEHE